MSFTFPRVLFFFLRRKMCSKWPGGGGVKKNTHKNDIQREKPLPPQACSCIVTAKRGKEEQRKKKLSKDLMHIEKKGENKTKPLSHTLHQKLSQISRTPRHPHTNTTRARKGELTSQRNVLIVCLLTGAERGYSRRHSRSNLFSTRVTPERIRNDIVFQLRGLFPCHRVGSNIIVVNSTNCIANDLPVSNGVE